MRPSRLQRAILERQAADELLYRVATALHRHTGLSIPALLDLARRAPLPSLLPRPADEPPLGDDGLPLDKHSASD